MSLSGCHNNNFAFVQNGPPTKNDAFRIWFKHVPRAFRSFTKVFMNKCIGGCTLADRTTPTRALWNQKFEGSSFISNFMGHFFVQTGDPIMFDGIFTALRLIF